MKSPNGFVVRLGRQVLSRLGSRLSGVLPNAPISRAHPRSATDASSPERSGFQIVFAQYDRKKYPGALERLIAVMTRFESVGYSILVVDNARPEQFVHHVDDRLTHIGGDNTSWEFSAFDRGLAYLDSIGARPAVYGLVTDAFAAYGESFLSLLDPSLVGFA